MITTYPTKIGEAIEFLNSMDDEKATLISIQAEPMYIMPTNPKDEPNGNLITITISLKS